MSSVNRILTCKTNEKMIITILLPTNTDAKKIVLQARLWDGLRTPDLPVLTR